MIELLSVLSFVVDAAAKDADPQTLIRPILLNTDVRRCVTCTYNSDCANVLSSFIVAIYVDFK